MMMSILDQLATHQTPHNGEANRAVAQACSLEPGLLFEIAAGLASADAGLAGDCAEVMTMLAEQHPELVAPYAGSLAGLLNHKKTRVRWEAMHALAFCAPRVPELIASLLPRLDEIIVADESIIVRDYAVDAVSRYAGLGPAEAQRAYPILRMACSAWDGKHAGHALTGLRQVALRQAAPAAELRAMAEQSITAPRAVIRKAAGDLLKILAKAGR
jgi:hypothetical protein